MNKRWILLGLVAAIMVLSYVFLPMWMYRVFYPSGDWGIYYVAWFFLSIILFVAVAGATRPKKSEIDVTTHSKEIINKKEVIVKVRCPYCKNVYDETLNTCPNCGASQ